MVDVRIKPLEWARETPTQWKPETWKAESLFGEYDIQREKDGTFSGFAPNAGTGLFNSLDEAKAAAQADYESRIRSTLSDAVDEREAEPVDERSTAQIEFEQVVAESEGGLFGQLDRLHSELEALRKRVAELEARVAELEKALEPFATAAGNFDGLKITNEDEWFAYGGSQSTDKTTGAITVADLRAARRVREGGKANG
jgi:hypothetical protein